MSAIYDQIMSDRCPRAERKVQLYVLWCEAFAEEAAVGISGAIGEESGIRREYFLPIYLNEAALIVGD